MKKNIKDSTVEVHSNTVLSKDREPHLLLLLLMLLLLSTIPYFCDRFVIHLYLFDIF